MTPPTTRLRAILETLAKCLADGCAQMCKGREHYAGKLRHDANCPQYDYGADVAEALEVVAELEGIRAATLAEAVQAVDALQPKHSWAYGRSAGFQDGINAALEALGRLGEG